MSLTGKHILSCDLFDRDMLEELFLLADLLQPVARGHRVCRVLEGAVLGSLFFEASTRTRLSFDSAFLRLGGAVSDTTGVTVTSITKGESLADTSRVVSGYFDVLVVRHPDEQAVHEIASATHVPVLNGGNGGGEHPTQALLDLYTLRSEFARMGKSLKGSRIALIGDLRHGRTVHSLLRLLSLYEGLSIVCVSPPSLPMPRELLDRAARRGHRIEETDNAPVGLKDADVVYATRIQKERFTSTETAFDYSADFRVDGALVNGVCKPEVVIMHPLPRDSTAGANDLSNDLDQDVRLAIFRQTDAGIPTRMALFASVLGVAHQVGSSLRDADWYRPKYIGPNDAPFYSLQ
ncbi:aspartate carbamoyltransferase [Verminephrobacter aporrectodeae subsp. tuberculatae]|uniref:aspartate carbamoyltransferase n=1 Tax=Verminephrobacter aporrectodeae TaxID=1110389 RepID=UPI0022388852|nr:aspartate carbamoyltransferase [Verminephrobacter aporrectodeae]MCW5220734.1 aspartate carbamoyltransferase [Verminephrobacter aporrectodeae subsp. tuberculatae]MCW5290029.1 aspartate carbamoyltransferase [Verminephrobacter aporrectodeae subsp. tuberculatae]